ncbi:hypothetical protein C4D60_Mb11t04550 [Musa balbisiana]|uniref:Uncharacterized protein n=1 Tax=Musa balbisiana TaxID=52838 RepID=A0A4V4H599_MUSBA|nr:hypothetical protein C4D60_Mb11t04550 [Musa balbisiana]
MAKNTSSRYARSPAPERRPEVDSKERLRPRPRPRPPHDGHRSDRRSGDDQSALALMNRRREELPMNSSIGAAWSRTRRRSPVEPALVRIRFKARNRDQRY